MEIPYLGSGPFFTSPGLVCVVDASIVGVTEHMFIHVSFQHSTLNFPFTATRTIDQLGRFFSRVREGCTIFNITHAIFMEEEFFKYKEVIYLMKGQMNYSKQIA